MPRNFNTLLIPVESQVRELDGKLLLACTAAEKGFTVIIGSRAHIHFYASKVNNAIYLAKSMRRFSDRMFNILHGLGHRIVAWDEEALVRLPDEQYYTHRLSPNTFKYIDHLFTWGKSDAQVFQNYQHYRGQAIHKTGNPRLDILRPELRDYFTPEKNNLLEKYGDYVLINTNFGQVNHFIPDVGTQEANRDKNFSRKDNDNFVSRRYTHKKTLFNAFQQMVPLLAKTFSHTHFILRPHPSESLTTWRQCLDQYSNISVTNQGNVIPWIMGAKALISNGCTTSIEATVLDRPTIGYYPIMDDSIDDKLPKSLCDIAQTNEQLIEKLSSLDMVQQTGNNTKNKILANHVSSLTGTLACDKIVNIIDSHYSFDSYDRKYMLEKIPSIIHNNARTLVKRVKSNRASCRNNSEYHKHRFPHISDEYLKERINRFSKLSGNFTTIKIQTIADDVFKLTN